MTIVLVDYNIEGQAALLWAILSTEGWPELFPLRFVTFADIGLSPESSDREAWRFAQENGMVLLTGNRRMREDDSLEKTVREENTPTSLPVLTISKVDRIVERAYRERYETRLLEIILYLDNYLGTARIFIP